MKYLFGAAVQGIQNFIFQTNKLREIVGASELVEQICTQKFKDLLNDNYKEENCILHAAGNIKYIFDNEEDCKKIVRIFPKTIAEFAPGITVSQAVVKMEREFSEFNKAVNELEKRLRTQRNKPMRSQTLGLMGILRSNQTGLPVVDIRKEIFLDAGTKAKRDVFTKKDNPNFELTKSLCNTAFGIDKMYGRQIAYDIENITMQNDWIAIIHADGNGLGQVVQSIGTDSKKFKEFSEKLDKATKNAAVEAFTSLGIDKNGFIPIRPIVLGGDDFTVICRADLALNYVTSFIQNFEKETHFVNNFVDEKGNKILPFNNLTACAGIAFIKSSFPFYYGYELAESLCSRAKKDAKENLKEDELAKSCLMFHKVQDSFTKDWEAIVKRELSPQKNISFEFGPYYINEKKDDTKWLVADLLEKSKQFDSKEGNAVKSHLRQWMSLLHDNPEMASQKLERLLSMTQMKKFVKDVTTKTNRGEISYYPVYDMLAIHTINTQKTKEDKK